MTQDDIRALNGPALTRLAWELGLAPQGSKALTFFGGERSHYYTHEETLWEPCENLVQADAVFRGLRVQHWHTANAYYGDDGFGKVSVRREQRSIAVYYNEGQDSPTEAHAMLLVSVMAMMNSEHTWTWRHAP